MPKTLTINNTFPLKVGVVILIRPEPHSEMLPVKPVSLSCNVHVTDVH